MTQFVMDWWMDVTELFFTGTLAAHYILSRKPPCYDILI